MSSFTIMFFHKRERSKVSYLIGRRIPPMPAFSVVVTQWIMSVHKSLDPMHRVSSGMHTEELGIKFRILVVEFFQQTQFLVKKVTHISNYKSCILDQEPNEILNSNYKSRTHLFNNVVCLRFAFLYTLRKTILYFHI